ncbi:MAG: hypothetical protein SFX74_08830 [Fimbriimonadaceae bacterium]|nr:hypothetical protein [Fimbriimonadaceae bacterium]
MITIPQFAAMGTHGAPVGRVEQYGAYLRRNLPVGSGFLHRLMHFRNDKLHVVKVLDDHSARRPSHWIKLPEGILLRRLFARGDVIDPMDEASGSGGQTNQN